MFTRPRIDESEQISTISIATPIRPARARRLLWLLKPAFAGGMVLVGVIALSGNAQYITSDNAVVTAHVVSLRAPIEGVVHFRTGEVGQPVVTSMPFAEIENPLVDDRQIVALQSKIKRLHADIAASKQALSGLNAMLVTLLQRADRHREAKVAQMSLDLDRTIRDRNAKADQLEQLVRDMRRKVALTGTVSNAEIEQTQTAVRVAADQVASLDRQVAAAQAATRAVENGVLVDDNSNNDVGYSEQRADEVRERVLDLTRVIAGMQAELDETAGQLAGETDMVGRLRTAILRMPAAGMIWRLGAAPGERVGTGDLLAQVVDCHAAFLAVAVPQDRLPDIALGAAATFRLAGAPRERSGHISAITGEAAVQGDTALAAVPTTGTRPLATVLIDVPPSPNEVGRCLVGRTARVLLPTIGGGWIDWVERRLPLWSRKFTGFQGHAGV